MKTQNLSCEAKVEIISKSNAILLVDKKDVADESIQFKYNDNVATLVAKNTANAKMTASPKSGLLCPKKTTIDAIKAKETDT